MSNIKIINGNLLDATEKYIMHQINCKTTNGLGLSKSIFNKFPSANIYILEMILKMILKENPVMFI